MFAKLAVAAITTAVASSAIRDAIEGVPSVNEKDKGYGRYALRCMAAGFLTTIAVAAIGVVFSDEETPEE